MAYEKTNWKDQISTYPNRYTQTDNADGTKTIVKSEGPIIQLGTPLSASNLNKVENALLNLDITKSNLGEVHLKNRKLELEDTSATFISAITGGATVNLLSIPQDLSVTPIKNASTVTPITKNTTTYTSFTTVAAGNVNNLYVPKPSLNKGNVNVIGKFAAGTTHFFLLKKEPGSLVFQVKKKITVTTTEGINTILTNFIAEGDGTEFLGFMGYFYYKTTGGIGFYEGVGTDHTLSSVTIEEKTAALDFALYYTYSDIALVERITTQKNDLTLKIDAVDQKYMEMLGQTLGNTVVKSFTGHGSLASLKTYIPNTVLSYGHVKIHFKAGATGQMVVYILKKNGLQFTVLKAVTVPTVIDQILSVDMGYLAQGDGTEFFGYYGRGYYKATGGTGMYEATVTTQTEGSIFDASDSTTGAGALFDFAFYPEYTSGEIKIVQAVYDLRNELEDLQNEVEALQPQPADVSQVLLTDFNLPRYVELPNPVGFVGRWFDKTIDGIPCKVTINQGSEFYFKVKNTTNVAINFKVITASQMPYFAYSIDGGPMTRQLINAPNLPVMTTGEHIIRVVVDGLTESENKWIGEIGVAFVNVVVDPAGTLKGILPKNKMIMFFGDSITEGIRTLTMDANANGNSATGAFPFTTCQNLNAISHRVGFGATGVTNAGSGGVPKCLTYIDNVTSLRETPYYEPDVIVINHGTNDGGATAVNFETEYNAVLTRLNIKYPGVPIFAVIPFNQPI